MKKAFTLFDTLVGIIILGMTFLILMQMLFSVRTSYYASQGSITTYREAANFINISHAQVLQPYAGMISTYEYHPYQVRTESGNYIDTGSSTVVYTYTPKVDGVTQYSTHRLRIQTPLPNSTETIDHNIEVYHEEL